MNVTGQISKLIWSKITTEMTQNGASISKQLHCKTEKDLSCLEAMRILYYTQCLAGVVMAYFYR